MKNKKILFLSISSALLLILVLFVIQACDLSSGGFGSKSKTVDKTLAEAWDGTNKTFLSNDCEYAYTIKFDGDKISIDQILKEFDTQRDRANIKMRGFYVDPANEQIPFNLSIGSIEDIEAAYQKNKQDNPNQDFEKTYFYYYKDDKELTINIIGKNNLGSSQHVVTFRADGSYKFLVLISADDIPAPTSAQNAFEVEKEVIENPVIGRVSYNLRME